MDLVFPYFLSYFIFIFDLVFYFLFLELRVRVKVVRSCCHTSVTSDDIVTDHEIYRRMMLYNKYNCCGNHFITKINDYTSGKSLKSDIEWEVHKRT